MTKTISLLVLALPLVASSVALEGCSTTRTLNQRTDDDFIGLRVGRRLTADPDVRRYKIDVDVIDGVVTLRGQVESQAMAERAVALAESTEGVVRVENQLMIEGDDEDEEEDDEDERDDEDEQDGEEQGDGSSDIGIKTSVGARLMADPEVRRMNIDIDVVEGVVFLSGVVEDQEAKDSAERIASAVDGVKRVQNDLQVQPQMDPANQEGQPEEGANGGEASPKKKSAEQGTKSSRAKSGRSPSGK